MNEVLLWSALGGIVAANVIALTYIVRKVRKLEHRLTRVFAGKNAVSLEDAITSVQESIAHQNRINETFAKEFEIVRKRLRSAVRGVATVRFNAFERDGSGGNQSFATAFIDEDGNGVIVSSIYGRERFIAFAKPINDHRPDIELSEEEQTALTQAQERLRY